MHQRHQDNFLYVQTYLAIKRILILILILTCKLAVMHKNTLLLQYINVLLRD